MLLSRPTIDDVRAAAARLAPHAHRTPLATSRTLDARAGCAVYAKCENLQRVGAFKFRGACNAVLALSDELAARGVVTHSSGNHAQALALAARIRGIPAHIVMPTSAPAVKRRAVEAYGATVHECAPTLEAREATAAEVIDRTGGTLVHPYDDPMVIAGQGTMALELLEQAPPLDAVIVPVGGGGMLSGVSLAVRALSPRTRIIAAEPAGADDVARSLATDQLVPQTAPDTIADGLLTGMSPRTWSIIREHVERVVTVTDEEIVAAMRFVWERMKLVVEPSGAVGVAAALSAAFAALDGIERAGVILCGGNVDLDALPWST